MLLNEDGWLLTAGHVTHQIDELHSQTQSNQSRAKRRKKDRATHYSVLVGNGSHQPVHGIYNLGIDIGVARLEGFSPPADFNYPVIRSADVAAGELLCRIGYPFVGNPRPKWSREGGFSFTNLVPIPLFVNEALVSRFAELEGGGIWIETSSPGLMGQSGGPLADADGVVCGIQVNTHHYALGFQGSGRNQVLNVGRAVHATTVRAFLEENDIRYQTKEGWK